MKYFKKIRLLAVLLVGVVVLAACTHTGDDIQTEGNTYFSLAYEGDAIADVNEINVTAGDIEVYNQADDNWVNVAVDADEIDILGLEANDRTRLITATDLEAGTYQRVRMDIDSIEIVNNNDEIVDVTLAAETVEFDLTFQVSEEENQAAHITFSVLVNDSLFTTEEGDFVFVPVVEASVITDAEVEVDSNRNVSITGGTQADEVQVGVDLEGNSRANYMLDPGTELEIDLFGNVTRVEDGETENGEDGENGENATSTDENATSTDENATSTDDNTN